MQIELVETNSLGHTDQIGNILQPTFATRPSGSSDNSFHWSHGSDSFRSNPRRNPVITGVVAPLETTVVTGPFISSLGGAVHRNCFTRPVQNETMNRLTQANLFAPNDCPLSYRDAPVVGVMPSVNQAGGFPSSSSNSNADDFIEPDLSCRSVPYSYDGDTPEVESGASHQLHIQPRRPPVAESSTGPYQSQHKPVPRSRLSMCPFRRPFQAVTGDSSTSRPVVSPPSVIDDFGSSFPIRGLSCLRETLRRTRSSSPSSNSQWREPVEPANSDSVSISLSRMPSDSPCSFYSPLQSSISSSASSSSSFVHRPPMKTSSSLDNLNTNTTNTVAVLSPGLSLEAPNPSHHQYRCTPTPTADKSMESLSHTHSVMLLSTNELALGGSLTCTVVNILKGLRLLHRCGLEDLCVSLYGFRSIEPNASNTSSAALEERPNSRSLLYSMTNRALLPLLDSFVIRSSSFTSAALVSPRRSTVPRDYSQNGDLCAYIPPGTGTVAQIVNQNNCLVNYILTCSRIGSSLIYPLFNSLSRSGPGSLASHTLPHYPSGIDWRRGCASNLVNLLTSNSACVIKSRTPVSRLVAGRFLMGLHAWRSVWPYSINGVMKSKLPDLHGRSLSSELIDWICTWIRHGAVIVFAQLINTTGTCQSESNVEASELLWSHRLVYGVSQNANEVYLSNPIESVPVDDILHQLSRQTTLRLEKSVIDELWSEHLSYTRILPSEHSWSTSKSGSTFTTDSPLSKTANNREHTLDTDTVIRHEGVVPTGVDEMEESTDSDMDEADALGSRMHLAMKKSPLPAESHPHGSCMGDFSPLACQLDPRWNELNVLGQVLQTLRDLGSVCSVRGPGQTTSSGMAGNCSLERSSLSSSIVIPCAQSPGFSLFVPKTDWELVHTLYAPPPFNRPDH